MRKLRVTQMIHILRSEKGFFSTRYRIDFCPVQMIILYIAFYHSMGYGILTTFEYANFSAS